MRKNPDLLDQGLTSSALEVCNLSAMEESLTIQEAAARSGLSVHALRYYERAGLLPGVARQTGGHRRYHARDLAAVEFITKMRTTGMPIRHIRAYLELPAAPEAAGARLEILRAHRSEVCRQVTELEACLGLIDRKIAMYSGGYECVPENDSAYASQIGNQP